MNIERIVGQLADLMTTTHGQMILAGAAVIGIFFLRGPNGKI